MKKSKILISLFFITSVLFTSYAATPQKAPDFMLEFLNLSNDTIEITPLIRNAEGLSIIFLETRTIQPSESTLYALNSDNIISDTEKKLKQNKIKFYKAETFALAKISNLSLNTSTYITCNKLDSLKNSFTTYYINPDFKISHLLQQQELLKEEADFNTNDKDIYSLKIKNHTNSNVCVTNFLYAEQKPVATTATKILKPNEQYIFSYNTKNLIDKSKNTLFGICYSDTKDIDNSKTSCIQLQDFKTNFSYEINNLADSTQNTLTVDFDAFHHDITNETLISAKDKKAIQKTLFEQYSGRTNLSLTQFESVKTVGDLINFLKTNIKDDNHFYFKANCSCGLDHTYLHLITGQQFDKNSFKSADQGKNISNYVSTNNAEYVRISDKCDNSQISPLNKIRGNKKFILLDYRTNSGGNNIPQTELFERLVNQKYQGQVIILQDNYSYSGGEVAMSIPYYDLNWLVVGQHSGGMQMNGNCVSVEIGKFFFWLPTVYRSKEDLGERWEGEGIGFKPDVFIEKISDFVPYFKSLGIDMTGIQIQ